LADARLEPALTLLLEQFQTQQPGLTPTLTLYEPDSFPSAIQEAIQAGGGPDLIIGDSALLQTLYRANLLYPLGVSSLQELALVTPGAVFESGMDREGVLYSFPLRADAPLLYRNVRLAPDEVRRFEDFLTLAGEVGALIPPDFYATASWLQPANAMRPITPLGDLDISAVEVTAYLERMAQLQALPTVQFRSDSSPFLAGEVGLYVGTSQQVVEFQTALGDALAIQALPLAVGRTNFPLGQATMMMMSLNATDANAQAAQALMEFLFQAESQERLSVEAALPPIFPSLTDDPLLQSVAVQIQQAQFVPLGQADFYEERLPRYNNALAQVLSGVLTPSEAAASLFDSGD
jgi:ABC-type glycerol-3-phosphate transport system substrate-binding protein